MMSYIGFSTFNGKHFGYDITLIFMLLYDKENKIQRITVGNASANKVLIF